MVVELRGIESMEQIELDVTETEMHLRAVDLYLLDIQLPFAVSSSEGTAKFIKNEVTLEVTLPTIPHFSNTQPGSQISDSQS